MLVSLLLLVSISAASCKSFCYPKDGCWPSDQQINQLRSSIAGKVVTWKDADYKNATFDLVANLRFSATLPAVIAFVANENDVVACMKFVKLYSLKLSILSSGHSYIGTSVAEDSFQINLSRMRLVTTNTSDTKSPTGASAEVQSGAPWIHTYEQVDKVGYLIVGGSAPTVSAGGYTQGGGHSPMTPSLGLAVDNVLEMTVITADFNIRRINAKGQRVQFANGTVANNSDTDLFWALRGGGGGTYGVVTSYKYKIHKPPSGFVHVLMIYPYLTTYAGNVGEPFMDILQVFQRNVSSKWGGYILLTQSNDPEVEKNGILGTVTVSFLHFGPTTPTMKKELDLLTSYRPDLRVFLQVKNHSTFYDYQRGVNDPRGYTSYLANALQQEDDLGKKVGDTFTSIMRTRRVFGCTFTLLGGKMKDYSYESSSISRYFRDARNSLSCGIGMLPYAYKAQIDAAQGWAKQIEDLGKGMYFNEPDERRVDWKNASWGDNYPRLLKVKQRYDPGDFFSCLHCVGWKDPTPPTTPPSPQTTAAVTPSFLERLIKHLGASSLIRGK